MSYFLLAFGDESFQHPPFQVYSCTKELQSPTLQRFGWNRVSSHQLVELLLISDPPVVGADENAKYRSAPIEGYFGEEFDNVHDGGGGEMSNFTRKKIDDLKEKKKREKEEKRNTLREQKLRNREEG